MVRICSSSSTAIRPRSALPISPATRAAWSGIGQPLAAPAGDLGAVDLLAHHLVGEEVRAHELPEGGAHLVLAGGDDRGVRDGQAEGVAEQCGDREPVGQGADHRCLGPCLQVAEPPVRARADGHDRDRVDRGGQDEQPGGHGLHPAQTRATGLVRPPPGARRRGLGRVGRRSCRAHGTSRVCSDCESRRGAWCRCWVAAGPSTCQRPASRASVGRPRGGTPRTAPGGRRLGRGGPKGA